MATGTNSPPPLPANAPANRLIDDQLARVGTTLKSSDIGGGLMQMVAGLLAIVLFLVLVDHWIVGLPIWGRCFGLLSLLAWVGFCTARWVLPGAFSRINPAYAAQLVERSNPGLRNSLLNFILLRDQRDQLKEPVYRVLEHRATARVQSVDAEAVVDRHSLIRVALVAATLLFVFALYTALSPKSPISTLARLILPWKSIDRPSRVRVVDVRPGSATVYSGQMLEVSARVERAGDDDPVQLIYSTVDEQEVDQILPMKLDEASGRYTVNVPRTPRGIRADLDYRIESGDAMAGPYRVIVSPMPSVVVERVDYEYPKYTQLPPETVEAEGDIRAVEGTRVRIHAVANQSISSAYLEFDPDTLDRGTRRTIRMKCEGNQASVSFRLRLREDRRTQTHESYQLRFVNANDETNDAPIQHRIDVDPDLPPIVEILTPAERVTDVPLDGAQEIEIRGLDPDFGLANMTLHGVARGTQLFEPRSLLGETSHGQVVRRLTFRPTRFKLREGDLVEIWATGFDNRFDVFEQTEAPNMAQPTDRYRLRITAPTSRPPDKNSEDRNPDGQQDGSGERPSDPDDGEDGESEQDQGTDGQPGKPSASGDTGGQPSGGDNNQQDPADDSGDQPGQGDPSQGPTGQGEDRSKRDEEAGPSGEGKQDDQTGNGQSQEQPGQPQDPAGGEPSPAGTASPDDGSKDAANASDSRPPSTSNSDSDSGERNADPPDEDATSSEPLPSDGSSDGDAFERVLDRMRELNGENSDGTPKTGNEDEPASNESSPASEESAPETCPHCNSPKEPNAECKNCDGGGDGGESANESEAAPTSDRGAGSGRKGTPSDRAAEAGEDDPQDGEDGDEDGSQAAESGSERPGSDDSQPDSDEDLQTSESDPGQSGREGPRAGQDPGPPTSSDDETAGDAMRGQDEEPQGSPPPSDEGAPTPGESPEQNPSPSNERSGNNGQPGPQGSEPGEGQGAGTQPGSSGQPPAGSSDSAEAGDSGSESSEGSDSSAEGEPTSDSPTGTGGAGDAGEGDEAAGEDGAGTSDAGDSNPGGTASSPPSGGAEQGPASPSGTEGQPGSNAASGSQPQGGGGPNSGSTELPSDDDPGEPGGDDANLEYARKATDLALEYLEEQQRNPDPDLLERLGWTSDQLREFIQRWEKLRQAAPDPKQGAPGGEQLNDALRSLGLYPADDRLQRGASRDDDLQGVRDAGVRSAPPAEYEGPFKEFMRRRGKRTPPTDPRR